jgi:lysophospholipase L1-like esterase
VRNSGIIATLLLLGTMPAPSVPALALLLAPPALAKEPVLTKPTTPASSPALVRALSLVRNGRIAGPPPPELAKFRKRLADLKARRVDRVTIVQIGDSHTQAEHFSGRLRALLQARFGDAGRGMLPPGQPYDYWKPYRVQARQSGPWEVFTSNKTEYQPLPYGLSGFVVRAADPAAVMTLDAAEGSASFATIEVGYYRRPDGGTIDLTVDGALVGAIDTKGRGYARQRRSFALRAPGRHVALIPHGDGPVDIADWAVYGKARGIVLASFGFSGAQVGIMERWDWPTVRSQLATLDPALILLAFGTNEGYAPKSRLADYGSRLERRIRALQRAAPNASIVLVSGPDANLIPKYCSGGDRTTCRPLSESEVADYDAMLARSDRALCRWHTPGSYGLVRKAQREAAQRTGAYFWDWLELEGGMCGASRWEQAGLVWPDRVHMKKEGYSRSADQLYAVLMRGVPRR